MRLKSALLLWTGRLAAQARPLFTVEAWGFVGPVFVVCPLSEDQPECYHYHALPALGAAGQVRPVQAASDCRRVIYTPPPTSGAKMDSTLLAKLTLVHYGEIWPENNRAAAKRPRRS